MDGQQFQRQKRNNGNREERKRASMNKKGRIRLHSRRYSGRKHEIKYFDPTGRGLGLGLTNQPLKNAMQKAKLKSRRRLRQITKGKVLHITICNVRR